MDDKGLEESLYPVSKRDDQLQVIQGNDGYTYVETNQQLGGLDGFENVNTQPGIISRMIDVVTDDTLIEKAATARPDDVRNATTLNMFLAHSFIMLACVTWSLPFYYWPIPRVALIILICIGSTTFVGLYILMLTLRAAKNTIYSVASIIAWATSLVCVVGSSVGLAQNSAPIILMVMLWGQAMIVVGYTKKSAVISSWAALAFMLSGTLVVWCISIVTFVSRHDWIAGVLILVIALACAAYNAYQIRINETRYNVSLTSTITSVIQFYGDPALLLYDRIRNTDSN